MVISIVFGLTSLGYPIGQFSRIGPGLFPLSVSIFLFIISVSMVIRSFLIERSILEFSIVNISIITCSLVSFALVTEIFNMIAGIVIMIFISGFATRNYSVLRNVKLSVALIAVAFAFYKLLGLQLPLYQ